MKSVVYFGDERLKASYEALKDAKVEERSLHRWISKAIDELTENAFCGIQIPKRLIPKVYLAQYNIHNLWKYNLPKGWRLLYAVAGDEVRIISIVLEWMKHKDYEKRFKY